MNRTHTYLNGVLFGTKSLVPLNWTIAVQQYNCSLEVQLQNYTSVLDANGDLKALKYSVLNNFVIVFLFFTTFIETDTTLNIKDCKEKFYSKIKVCGDFRIFKQQIWRIKILSSLTVSLFFSVNSNPFISLIHIFIIQPFLIDKFFGLKLIPKK